MLHKYAIHNYLLSCFTFLHSCISYISFFAEAQSAGLHWVDSTVTDYPGSVHGSGELCVPDWVPYSATLLLACWNLL